MLGQLYNFAYGGGCTTSCTLCATETTPSGPSCVLANNPYTSIPVTAQTCSTFLPWAISQGRNYVQHFNGCGGANNTPVWHTYYMNIDFSPLYQCYTVTSNGECCFENGSWELKKSSVCPSVTPPVCNRPIDCAGTCNGTATDYNGSAAGCGTPVSPCGGSLPPAAVACNATAPSTATSREFTSDCTTAGACKYRCAAGYTISGLSCVADPLHTNYLCQSQG